MEMNLNFEKVELALCDENESLNSRTIFESDKFIILKKDSKEYVVAKKQQRGVSTGTTYKIKE